MENKYWKTKMYHMILILLLIGSLNWGATALGYNFIEIIKTLLNTNLKIETYIDKIIYFLVALAGILLATNRDLWLPFIKKSEFFTVPTVTTLNNLPPAPIMGQTPTVGEASGQATIYWTLPEKNRSTITFYKIKVYENNIFIRDISFNNSIPDSSTQSKIVTDLINGRSYSFNVSSINSAGNSQYSKRSSIIQPRLPPPT
jgi:uncharacterized membrane protein YuzA (DUF378 family)